MRRLLAAVLFVTFASNAPAVWAHHSFSMFDGEHPIEIEGAVKEFKFTSPHSFIVVVVPGKDNASEIWTLEGVSPAELVREGWSSKILKPGDEIKVKLAPFRSGVPGGSWRAQDVKFKDGGALLTH